MVEKKNKKRIIIIIASVLIAVCALLVWPNDEARAFESFLYDVTEFKGDNAQDDWTSPTQPGMVFAGWYEDKDCTKIYRETTGEAYAKFVDEKVLSVAKQFKTETTTASDKTSIRFITSIDTLKFKNVGFEVSVDCDPVKEFQLEDNYAYTSLLAAGDERTPANVFENEASSYFVLYSITNIPKAVFEDTFTVKPYWNTMDGTKVYGVTKTFTIMSDLTQEITLDHSVGVETTGAETFSIDLTEINDVIGGSTLKSVTVGGTAFKTSSYADNQLTLDMATVGDEYGAKTVIATFTTQTGKTVIVNIPITVCTMFINDEAELNTLPSVIEENGGGGYYALGNDIVCSGTYPVSGTDSTFTGTFDGCGYTIYNLHTAGYDDENQAFLGKTMDEDAKLMNVSFVNAKHKGWGGFIASNQYGTVENVYIQIDITPSDYTNYAVQSTSVLGSDTKKETKVNNVWIEYEYPLPSGSETGYAVYQMYTGYSDSCYNGLYVIGADEVMGVEKSGSIIDYNKDVYGAYDTEQDFKDDKVDVTSWENDFWTIVNGIPTPKRLVNPVDVSVNHYATNTLHKVQVTESERPFVVNGSSEYKIIAGEGDGDQEAAKYLVQYIEKATGCKLSFATPEEYTTGGKYIVLNVPALFAKAGLSMPEDDIGTCGYYIRTVGNNVFLATEDEQGSRFAILAFLRHVLGFKMYDAEAIVFEKDGTTLPDMNIIEKPDIPYFNSQVNEIAISSETRYMSGCTGTRYLFIDGQWCHTNLLYLPKATYQADHPDWYSTENTDICFTAHGDAAELDAMTTIIANRMLELMETDKNALFATISIMDVDSVCQCESCTKSAENYNGAYSAAGIQFTNMVNAKVQAALQEQAEEAGTEKRSFTLVFLAYYKMTQPPVKLNEDGSYSPIDDTVVCDEGVVPFYAPIAAQYNYSFYDSRNSEYSKMMKGWNACSDEVFCWLYETNFQHYMYPFNCWEAMLETYRFCVNESVTSILAQDQWNTEASTAFTGFKDYINRCALFDVNVNYNDIKEDYFSNYFLSAQEPMEQYFDELTAWMRHLEYVNSAYVTGTIYDQINMKENWPQEMLESWLELINEAYAAAEEYKADTALYESLINRIKKESMFIRYALIEHYSDTYAADVLEKMKLSFKNDAIELGFDRYGESTKHTLLNKYAEWNIGMGNDEERSGSSEAW